MTVHKSQFKKLVKINKLSECRKRENYEGKKIGNLDAKQLARIDKMWNDGNPEVRTSEKVEISVIIDKYRYIS